MSESKYTLAFVFLLIVCCKKLAVTDFEKKPIKLIEAVDSTGDTHYTEIIIKSFLKDEKTSEAVKDKLRKYQQAIVLRKEKARESIKELELKISVGHYPMANFKYYFQLAYLYHLREDLDKAQLFYQKSLQLKKSNALAWARLGLVFETEGKKKKSLKYLNKAVTLDATDPMVNLHLALYNIRQNNTEKALTDSKKFIEKWPAYRAMIVQLVKRKTNAK